MKMDMSNRGLCYFRLTETTTRPLPALLEHSMKEIEEITDYQEDIQDDLETVQGRITQIIRSISALDHILIMNFALYKY